MVVIVEKYALAVDCCQYSRSLIELLNASSLQGYRQNVRRSVKRCGIAAQSCYRRTLQNTSIRRRKARAMAIARNSAACRQVHDTGSVCTRCGKHQKFRCRTANNDKLRVINRRADGSACGLQGGLRGNIKCACCAASGCSCIASIDKRNSSTCAYRQAQHRSGLHEKITSL